MATDRSTQTTPRRPLCGGCLECLAITRALLTNPQATVHTVATTRKATAAEFERHAKRFGPEGVEATAKELGVEVKVERPTRRRRARGPSLRQRVVEHLADGRSAELIAEIENLTPTRARRIIEEVST